MPEAMTQSDNKTPLTEDDIIAWLKKNPRFLQQNPDAVDLLLPPREEKGKGIADFQYYMLQRLRTDRDEVVESTREIVATSRANMNSQARIHTAVLMLLEATDFNELLRTITMDFAAILDVDIVSLIVETEDSFIPHVDLTGVRVVTPGSIDLLMKDRTIILESKISGFDELYGGGAGLVKSQALARLNVSRKAPPMLLAFGSRDPELFQYGQGTELIAFLAKVIERCFRIWLNLST